MSLINRFRLVEIPGPSRQPAQVANPGNVDALRQLTALGSLRRRGLLSEEDYRAERAELRTRLFPVTV